MSPEPRHPPPGTTPTAAGAVQVALTVDPAQPPWLGPVADFSAWGVRLALDRRLSLGTAVDLRLHRPGRDFFCPVRATVVYVIEEPTGRFNTGCTFDRRLSDDELRGLR